MRSLLDSTIEQTREAALRGELTVAVVGCGWMGLPTALLFAEAGAHVIGVVKTERELSMLSQAVPTIAEPGVEELLKRHVESGRFKVTMDASQAASEVDAALIIVPTQVGRGKKPDYSALVDASRRVGLGVREGSLVILESTVGPGVTEELVKPELEKASGLKAGYGFGLAYSPIRASAGSVLRDLASYPRVLAGVDERSCRAAQAVLSLIVKGGFVKVRDIRTAEAVKLFENIYRDVNIALANQLALFCEAAGVDVLEAIEAANTQPYCRIHRPGVGVGGHCLPSNPYFLLEKARRLGVSLDLVRLARRINDSMPLHVIKLATSALRMCGKTLKGSSVAILGASFKEHVKDARHSPSIQLAERLVKRGAEVSIYDPLFKPEELEVLGARVAPSLEACVEGADCVIVAVAHEVFKSLDLQRLASLARMPAAIVDGRQVVDPALAKRAGFVYVGIGRSLVA
ncbi:MAG: nucleotide sugar dehydrogenase [Candidatus Nezhaarchaeota archaeon]|nr:nucleotide sugar dehydrogenase [Candidatus Nezhaarchaeota archaeon]